MVRVILLICVSATAVFCSRRVQSPSEIAAAQKNKLIESAFREGRAGFADGFDFPVGRPDARNYYSAQNFGDNDHLGEDWNRRGGNDLGDPVFAMANGIVVFAADHGGGWGNVLRIVHRLPDGEQVESLYSHLREMTVAAGTAVRKGDQIGTIGTAGGQYPAHLHLEVRSDIHLPIGGGYGRRDEMRGFLAPTPFILANRIIAPGASARIHAISTRVHPPVADAVILYTRAWKLSKLRQTIRSGADVNVIDEQGRSALYYAAAMGFTSAARLLLRRGARPDVRDHYGYTPMMRATFAFRSPSSLRRLLRRAR